ncbi:MAG: Nif11-like leader peptide family natural product precursor [Richelia sp. RM2_1_2]|nr:Nif11-like leader peptide family natural product precursor [Richelia sp. SM2_1_7]NJN07793.1 Nif11-like leader peptide family natural product precursor [Richelia sp. RM1_1_1]NJO28945.1 Nif11-like leader peptide family natural product precursor [Richelia sp. SL_2_1]NJO62081.1 Nif11-like leader peptide family natural product precursor [Richelia sp. RM2_1_2]
MSIEHVKAFYERLENDEAFRTQIQQVQSKEECSQIVKKAGYEFTQDELEEYTLLILESANDEGELQDLDQKELAGVIGGAMNSIIGIKPIIRPMYGLIPPDYFDLPIVQPLYGVIRVDEIM